MQDQGNENEISRLIKTAYRPVGVSDAYRDKLINVLANQGSATSAVPLWKQSRLWMIVLALIVLGLIGYGIWLPSTILASIG